MRQAKVWLWLVALLAVTAGTGLYLQHQAIESLKDTVAEEKLESLQTVSTIASLESDKARLQEALVARNAPPPQVFVQTLGDTALRSATDRRSRASSGESLRAKPEDPHRRYDAFVRSAALTAEQTEEFYRLVGKSAGERTQLQESLRRVATGDPMPGADSLPEQLSGATADELKGLLGSDGFSHFESYEKTSYYRAAFVDPISSALASGNSPLSDDQVNQLVALVASNDHPSRSKASDIDWDTVLKAAKSSLNPSQQAQLQGYVTAAEGSGN